MSVGARPATRCTRTRRSWASSLGVMTRVLIILVKGHAPRHLLRRRIDLDRAPKLADRCQHLPSDLTDRSVGRERDTDHWPVAVLDDRFVRSQIKHHHERSGAVRGQHRRRLPAPSGQTQRRVLKLRLGRASIASRSLPILPPRHRPRWCSRRSARRIADARRRSTRGGVSFDLAVNLCSGLPATRRQATSSCATRWMRSRWPLGGGPGMRGTAGQRSTATRIRPRGLRLSNARSPG